MRHFVKQPSEMPLGASTRRLKRTRVPAFEDFQISYSGISHTEKHWVLSLSWLQLCTSTDFQIYEAHNSMFARFHFAASIYQINGSSVSRRRSRRVRCLSTFTNPKECSGCQMFIPKSQSQIQAATDSPGSWSECKWEQINAQHNKGSQASFPFQCYSFATRWFSTGYSHPSMVDSRSLKPSSKFQSRICEMTAFFTASYATSLSSGSWTLISIIIALGCSSEIPLI
jgi:hypothetical protein